MYCKSDNGTVFEIIAKLNAVIFLLFNKFGVNLESMMRLFGRVTAKYIYLTVKKILK